MTSNDSASQPSSASSKPRRSKLPLIAFAIAAAFGLYTATAYLLEYRQTDALRQQTLAGWPAGNIEDLEALATRDDLNVLFILVDTLRRDRMSVYGYERETTPLLDSLMSVGVRFDRHLAQSSWTKASMASMWTSFNPTRTGVISYDDIIPEAAVLPAEVFKEEGFRTVGLYRNGWVAPVFGFGQGFEIYKKPGSARVDSQRAINDPTTRHTGTDEDVVRNALEFLKVEGNSGTPWFLYLHLMDLHEYTYDEESALFGSGYADLYDASIRWTDGTLDVLIRTLVDWGLMKDTIIVITSDHGEAFRERGHEGHARFVYRETTEIPFLILLPFQLADGGLVVHSRSRNVDVFPTLYEMLGIELPPELDGMDGVSLYQDMLDAARGQTSSESFGREGFAHLLQGWGQQHDTTIRPTYAMTSGNLRFVSKLEGDARVEELFDASVDPKEMRNLAEEKPEVLAELRERSAGLAEINPEWGAPEVRELNELELNQLRALGYKLE